MAAPKLICFDCDSTLSGIEGIDELARVCGSAVTAKVEAMTRDAMEGRVPIEDVFGRRLEVIRPSRDNVAAVGRKYIEAVEPTAKATVAALNARGWTPVIVSAGFTQAIAPLADFLGIQRIEAVTLEWTAKGDYRGYDAAFPTTRTGGKAEVIARLRRELSPSLTVMVGDGVSDLESGPVVDRFIGFGRYVVRPKVKAQARTFIMSLTELTKIL